MTALVVTTLRTRFADVNQQAVKELRYGLVIVGPDDGDNISDKWISRAPADGYIVGSNMMILFRDAGPPAARPFFQSYFSSLASQLSAAGLPAPELLINDTESLGDSGVRTLYGNTQQSVPIGDGYFETVLANPVEHSRMITTTQNLKQWAGDRAFTQEGEQFDLFAPDDPPAYDRAFYSRWPGSFERVSIVVDAARTNFVYALDHAIFQPFRAAFGADKRCGGWTFHCSSQEHQSPFLPVFRERRTDPDIPVQVQTPVHYGAPEEIDFSLNGNPGLASTHPGWSSTWNWLQAYQPAGFIPWTTYPTAAPPGVTSPAFLRMTLDVQCRVADAASRAAPDKPLMPVIGLGDYVHTQEDLERAVPYVVRYMVHAVERGAEGFWLFAPGWNDSGPTGEFRRSRNYQLVKAFNGAMQARSPMRNRVRRFGG